MDLCDEEQKRCFIFAEKANVACTHHTNSKVIAFISDLGLQNLSRWDDQGHKLTGVMHSKVVCLLHQHLADCQSSIAVASPFG